MTAQAAFHTWLFYAAIIAAVAIVVAFGIAIIVVSLSSSRQRDD